MPSKTYYTNYIKAVKRQLIVLKLKLLWVNIQLFAIRFSRRIEDAV